MIEVENLRFLDASGLETTSFNFVVPDGTITFLVGPAGSGKTGLLRHAMGLAEPISGRVLINDRPILQGNVRANRRRIGYLSQSCPLFPHLSGHDNLALAARSFGWSEEKVDIRIQKLAQLFHLSMEALLGAPHELSRNQIQRLAMMKAMMLEPTYLIADEPTAGLDRVNARTLIEAMRQTTPDLPATTLISTTDLELAMDMADRVAIIREGRLLREGTVNEIRANPGNKMVEEMLSRLWIRA